MALRKAAVAWAVNSRVSPMSADDREFKRIDDRLMRAAVRYAATEKPKFPRVPVPRPSRPMRTRRNEPARKRKHKGKEA